MLAVTLLVFREVLEVALLPEQSPPGQMLHVLAGYAVRPGAMQLVIYVTTAVVFFAGARRCRPQAPAAAAAV